jgi:hypothetical protein
MEAAHMVADAYCATATGDARYACEAGVVMRTCGAGCDEAARVSLIDLDRCMFDIEPMRFPASCVALF